MRSRMFATVLGIQALLWLVGRPCQPGWMWIVLAGCGLISFAAWNHPSAAAKSLPFGRAIGWLAWSVLWAGLSKGGWIWPAALAGSGVLFVLGMWRRPLGEAGWGLLVATGLLFGAALAAYGLVELRSTLAIPPGRLDFAWVLGVVGLGGLGLYGHMRFGEPARSGQGHWWQGRWLPLGLLVMVVLGFLFQE